MHALQSTKARKGRTTANISFFICSVADLLRGDNKRSVFDKVILPFHGAATTERVLGRR